MAIELYIKGKRVDIDDSTAFPFSYVYNDLQNPTSIVNDFSKTISIPATANNNTLFEHIYQKDHIPIEFDPSKRIDFVLINNGDELETGYIKLNEIVFDGIEPQSYNITLHGRRGAFFYNLDEKTLDELVVDPSRYNHVINKESVIASWDNEYYKYMLSYSGRYDNFNSDQLDGYSSYDVYYGADNVGVSPGAVIAVGNSLAAIGVTPSGDDGITMNGFSGQKVDGFTLYWRGIASKVAPSVSPNVPSGTPFVLVGPYWAAYSSGSGSIEAYAINYNLNAVTSNGNRFVAVGEGIILVANTGDSADDWGVIVTPEVTSRRFVSVTWCETTGYYYALADDGSILRANKTAVGWTVFSNSFSGWFVKAKSIRPTFEFDSRYNISVVGQADDNRGLIVDISGTNNAVFDRIPVSGTTMINDISYCGGVRMFCGYTEDTSGQKTGFVIGGINRYDGPEKSLNAIVYNSQYGWHVFGDGVLSMRNDNNWNWVKGTNNFESGDIPDTDEIQIKMFRSYYQRPAIRLKHVLTAILDDSGYYYELDDTFFTPENPYWENAYFSCDRLTTVTSELPLDHAENIRTGDTIDFQMMVKKGVSQLDFLLNYTKAFGLYVDYDRITETIRIVTRNTFFKNYEILDWTYRVDNLYNNKIVPLTFDFKTGVFKWLDNGTHYEVDYKDRYNRSFGSTEFETGYEFGNNRSEMITKEVVNNGVISQEYDTLAFTKDRGYRDDKILPAFFTKSNGERQYKSAEIVYLFYNGMQSCRDIWISDDTAQMRQDFEYYWSWENTKLVKECPLFTRLYEDSSLDFSRPAEYYYQGVNDDNYSEDFTIYNRFWKNFIEERYNSENKIFNAYVYIDRSDFDSFKFNTFVKIANTVWHINKITDYQQTEERSTLCELIRVNDITAYITGQNVDFREAVVTVFGYTYDDQYRGISNVAVTIRVGNQTKNTTSGQTGRYAIDFTDFKIGDIVTISGITPDGYVENERSRYEGPIKLSGTHGHEGNIYFTEQRAIIINMVLNFGIELEHGNGPVGTTVKFTVGDNSTTVVTTEEGIARGQITGFYNVGDPVICEIIAAPSGFSLHPTLSKQQKTLEIGGNQTITFEGLLVVRDAVTFTVGVTTLGYQGSDKGNFEILQGIPVRILVDGSEVYDATSNSSGMIVYTLNAAIGSRVRIEAYNPGDAFKLIEPEYYHEFTVVTGQGGVNQTLWIQRIAKSISIIAAVIGQYPWDTSLNDRVECFVILKRNGVQIARMKTVQYSPTDWHASFGQVIIEDGDILRVEAEPSDSWKYPSGEISLLPYYAETSFTELTETHWQPYVYMERIPQNSMMLAVALISEQSNSLSTTFAWDRGSFKYGSISNDQTKQTVPDELLTTTSAGLLTTKEDQFTLLVGQQISAWFNAMGNLNPSMSQIIKKSNVNSMVMYITGFPLSVVWVNVFDVDTNEPLKGWFASGRLYRNGNPQGNELYFSGAVADKYYQGVGGYYNISNMSGQEGDIFTAKVNFGDSPSNWAEVEGSTASITVGVGVPVIKLYVKVN